MVHSPFSRVEQKRPLGYTGGLFIHELFIRSFDTYPLLGNNTYMETIIVLLLILWFLGLISSYTLGGFIHVLLVIAIIMLIVRLIRGKSSLA